MCRGSIQHLIVKVQWYATIWQESHLVFLGSSVPYSSLSRDDTLIPRQTEFRAFLDVSQVGAGCGLLGLAVARLAQLGLRNGEFESCFAQSFWILVAFFYPNHQKTYGCFQKRGYPQLIHFDRVFHYKPIHFGFFSPVFGNTHIINRSNIWCNFCFCRGRLSSQMEMKRQGGNPTTNCDAKFWGHWKRAILLLRLCGISRETSTWTGRKCRFQKSVFFSISEHRQPVILKEPASSILLRINLAKQLTRIS